MTMIDAAAEAIRRSGRDMGAARKWLTDELRRKWRGEIYEWAAERLLSVALERDRRRIRAGGDALTQGPSRYDIEVQAEAIQTAGDKGQQRNGTQSSVAPSRTSNSPAAGRATVGVTSNEGLPAPPAGLKPAPFNDVIRRAGHLPGYYGWCPRNDGIPVVDYTPDMATRAIKATAAAVQTGYEKIAVLRFIAQHVPAGQHVRDHVPEEILAWVAAQARKRFSLTVGKNELPPKARAGGRK